MMYIAKRIGIGAFGKVRRAAGYAQNPQKGERAEMMASTVAVVESGKAFRVATDVGCDDSAKNVLLSAIAYDENMGTSD